MKRLKKEYSAGGVITRGGKVLLIEMKTLSEEFVWTYPKGHLEEGETPRRAALRETLEETGYECAVRAPLALIRYSFVRKKHPVQKRVRWYWMEPLRKMGLPDPGEIYGMKWLPFAKAEKLLRYPADFRLLKKARRFAEGGAAR